MLNYLIMGQVPGTNFQITFYELLLAFDLFLTIYLLRRRHIIRELEYYWIYIHFYFLTKRTRHLRLPI